MTGTLPTRTTRPAPAPGPQPRRAGWLPRLARFGASLLGAAALVAGLPWLLLVTVGNPLDQLDSLLAGDVTNQVVLAALASVVWLGWAQFTVALVVEAVSAVRRTPVPRRIPGVFAAQQGLARALVNGALLVLPVTAAAVSPAAQAIAMAPPPAAATTHVTPDPLADAPRGAAPTHTVTVTDEGPRTWWDLAAEQLGDGAAWWRLWEVNAGRVQPDGAVLDSERLPLRPGWTVLVPTIPGPGKADPAPVEVEEPGATVTVQPGDTLSELAAAHGVSDWRTVWPANAGRAEPGGRALTDPDYLEPGWTIRIPDAAREDRDPAGPVTVRPGDTLSEIAAAHDADLDAVITANRGAPQPDGRVMSDPDVIYPGWRITVPGTGPVDEAMPAAPPVTTAPPTPSAPADADDMAMPRADISPPAVDVPPATDDIPTGSMSAPATPGQPRADAQQPAVAAADPPVDETPAAASLAVTGVSGVLAALLAATLLRRRRRSSRFRRPGRPVPSTPRELLAVDRAVNTAGSMAARDAQFLQEALRGLARQVAAAGGRLPEVRAARLTDSDLTLLLEPAAAAADPVGAWQLADEGWVISRSDPTGFDAACPDGTPAPYPTLVTVGTSAGGNRWLLDLEQAGVLRIGGNADRAVDLARFLAAELAHNTWADCAEVTLVGFGGEMADMHPARLHATGDAAAAAADAARAAETVRRAVAHTSVEMLVGRLTGGDVWDPRVLLAGPDAAADPAMRTLLTDLARTGERFPVAAVVVDPDGAAPADEVDGWGRLVIDADGILQIPALGLHLVAHQLPQQEAARLAQLLAFAANPIPAQADSEYAEPDHPVAAGRAAAPRERAGTVLASPDQRYLERAATTPEDLRSLTVPVSESTRSSVEAADPGLDEDLVAFRDSGCPRPRVYLLGPVTVRSPAAGPRGLSPFTAEIVAYLATHPDGVGIEQYATDLWPDDPAAAESVTVKTKVRASASQVRRLLGVNPRTGEEYLPRNTGLGAVYRLDRDVLVDADLFRRLRLRGLARGADGIEDLWAALRLVTGPPLSARRPGGYGWLSESALDHVFTAMIVDLAHTLATHHLGGEEPARAAEAAEVALRAGSGEDTPLLDLIAAAQARGDRAQAEALVRRILAVHEVDDEVDLPPRTYDILRRRRWLPPAA